MSVGFCKLSTWVQNTSGRGTQTRVPHGITPAVWSWAGHSLLMSSGPGVSAVSRQGLQTWLVRVGHGGRVPPGRWLLGTWISRPPSALLESLLRPLSGPERGHARASCAQAISPGWAPQQGLYAPLLPAAPGPGGGFVLLWLLCSSGAPHMDKR